MLTYFSRKTPCLRLLIYLCAGILFQWYLAGPVWVAWLCMGLGFFLVTVFFFLPLIWRYRLSVFGAAGAAILFAGLGAALVWYQDVSHHPAWAGLDTPGQTNIATQVVLLEPLVEKSKSYKANAIIRCRGRGDSMHIVKGKLILYFQKDSLMPNLEPGSQLIFKKPLQEIKNAGNPGGFNYKRYALFQGITHQVYLQPGDYIVLPQKKISRLNRLLVQVQQFVLGVIRKYVPGVQEAGLAEALLIGYKNDLDKTLVQSYTNTGVVHIIAISGLHLGLIYWLLRKMLQPLSVSRRLRWAKPVLILAGLWFFSLLAGGQPSILRAAVMFSCIIVAENINRKGSIYNTLAFSALLLLCINPFWLWDVGFQLSYIAVLSIVIFMKPVYRLLYFKQKWLDYIWQMNAVTLAAQILTLPVSIYHFHQFPAHFFLSNLVAVPLSSIILLALILLCVVSPFAFLSYWVGTAASWVIYLLNKYIQWMEALPGSLWDALQINMLQVVLLYIAIAGFGAWWLAGSRRLAMAGLLCLMLVAGLRVHSFYQASLQQKLIVYNVPRMQAIDFISGRDLYFAGDSSLLADDFTRNFHLKPSRILHRTDLSGNWLGDGHHYFVFGKKKIIWLKEQVNYKSSLLLEADLLILSGNPVLYMSSLLTHIKPQQVVIDGSVPERKAVYWKKDCDALGIPCFDVRQHGAFVMNLR